MPGTVKSKRQARFLGAVAAGKAKKKSKGLSRVQAKEILRGESVGRLPETAPKKKRRK